MKRLQAILDVDYEKHIKKKWDNVLIIAGDEGISKSTLGLHILEYWYTKLYNEIKASDVKHMCLDIKQFLTDLKELKIYEMIIYDEAGDLSNLRVMNRFNYGVSKSYQVIRGLMIYTILILPSVFDLNPFFTKRRARGLIQVYKRGRFAFWNKKKLRETISYNASTNFKNVWKIKPLWRDSFPKYKGVLLKPYLKKKEEKIQRVRIELYNEIFKDEIKAKEKAREKKEKAKTKKEKAETETDPFILP